MGIQAGKLRHRITLQEYRSERDGYNNELDPVWTDVRKLWAKVEFLSVKDTLTARADGTEINARLIIRKRSDITTLMRVLWGGYVFQVISPAKPDNDDAQTYATFELKVVE